MTCTRLPKTPSKGVLRQSGLGKKMLGSDLVMHINPHPIFLLSLFGLTQLLPMWGGGQAALFSGHGGGPTSGS
jgi:hypothetical protein